MFLTLVGTPTLRMLVNREGFVPESGYEHLTDLLRTGISLSVRVRAAAGRPRREQRSEERLRSAVERGSRQELKQQVEASVGRASDLAQQARRLAAKGDFTSAAGRIDDAAKAFSEASDTSERLMTEGAILRVLASVGTQMAAFVHEINALLGAARALEKAIAAVRNEVASKPAARRKLARVEQAVGDLRRSVERQASYLTDVVSPDARRRRSRQRLADRFDAGVRLVAHAAERGAIEISNEIPHDLKSPPMFPAELTLVFSNLLTNAVKAAGPEGRIHADGKRGQDGEVLLQIANTGKRVNVAKSERWFRPFESTTVKSDPVLGQGMGMGLTITRNMLEEYGATIEFVKPAHGYSTALEIRFPG